MAAQKVSPGPTHGTISTAEKYDSGKGTQLKPKPKGASAPTDDSRVGMFNSSWENPEECTVNSFVTMGEKGKYRCVNVSPGGVPKPKNGECPHCSTSAYTGKPNEIRSLGGVWEIREFAKDRRAMVECSHCRTIFAVTVNNWG